ncbi:glycoside hydrolase family 28 protein [Microthyrium microscopicum]|uniref:galacturonan 1,4-alpha-galacturonidase n=1 Tax=Microthyrium microscopicum TaxID=703497 RepID=A0A6A6UUY8_9PEZI|nr:glycoside hydrolase family 28 protein [Microthyrium microscopicum]
MTPKAWLYSTLQCAGLLGQACALPDGANLGVAFTKQDAWIDNSFAAKAACPSGTDNWGNCVAKDRKVVTIRASADDKDDVSADFEKGLREANGGGLLHLAKGKTYMIGKKLELDWLKDVYVQLEGTIKFTNDIDYWTKTYVYHPFQKSSAFWRWGGSHIKIFGGGTMDGNGQKWWDTFESFKKDITDPSNTFLRPVTFFAENATHLDVTDINFLNSPSWFTFFVGSKDITFDRTNFLAKSTTKARPHNTDGFDTFNVDGFRLTNSRLEVDDDCYSAKPNTTNVHIENVWCKGTHGVSMGSIGQYPGVLDYITNVFVKNVTFVGGQNGARIKAWAGEHVGYGYVKNITFTDLDMQGVDQPIVLDQCYINIKPDVCRKFPSKVNTDGVKFINIKGTSSGKRDWVGSLKCSTTAECKNIEIRNVEITNPKKGGKGVITCDGIKNVTGSCQAPKS